MNVGDLVRAMEAIAPVRFAADWDNVGLIVGDEQRPLARVLLAIDCTAEVLAEALREGADAIVAYHPPVFAAQKRFVAGSVAFEAARAGIAIHSPHTALDVAEGGTNDFLADVVGMTSRRPLRPSSHDVAAGPGMGRVGPLAPSPVRALIDRAKAALAIDRVLVAGPIERDVTTAAVCAGSGGEFLGDALQAGAQLYLTGELRHHDALRAAAAGLTVICALHSASERAALAPLAQRLIERLPGVVVTRSLADREPFSIV
jgi:dinuclear metal center YbgI/SA1388 family protein